MEKDFSWLLDLRNESIRTAKRRGEITIEREMETSVRQWETNKGEPNAAAT